MKKVIDIKFLVPEECHLEDIIGILKHGLRARWALIGKDEGLIELENAEFILNEDEFFVEIN